MQGTSAPSYDEMCDKSCDAKLTLGVVVVLKIIENQTDKMKEVAKAGNRLLVIYVHLHIDVFVHLYEI